MRKRMIDPEIFDSAESKDWTADDFTIMVAAICTADDEGRGRIAHIKRNTISMISEKKFQKSLRKLSDAIIIYQKIYFFLPNFKKYQTISHPKQSKFPKPNPLDNKDLTSKESSESPESFHQDSILSKVSLKEVSLNKVKENANVQPSNSDLPLPLLTKNQSTEPEDYENIFQVTDCIKNLIENNCSITPDKSTLSTFVSLVTNTKQVKNRTAFKLVRDTFIEFNTLPDEKKNLKYLYSRAKGKISDGLIKAREQRSKVEKETERKEMEGFNDPNISQVANKIQYS